MFQKIYIKEFSFLELIKEFWIRLTENLQSILIITAVIYVPINLILSLVQIGNSFESFQLYFRIAQILEIFVGVIATMAIAVLIKHDIDEEPIEVWEALKIALSSWGGAIGTSLLLGLYLIGLFLFFIIPGIIFSIYWGFTLIVVVLHNKTGQAALDHSKNAVEDRWWAVFGYFLIIGIMTLLVSGILAVPLEFFPQNFFLSILGDTLASAFTCFMTVFQVVLFINLDATKIPYHGE